ncbi:MAG: penicillin-binding transpeptidase domain-containing protein [Anaeromyxobacter sp.]
MVFRSAHAWLLSVSALLLAGSGRARSEPPAAGLEPAATTTAAASTTATLPAPSLVPDPNPPEPVTLGRPHLDLGLGRWVAPVIRDGAADGEAILTIDPNLQAKLERSLENWTVPWGAIVMLDPRDGRVLALAEHSHAQPARQDLALSALSPAASIFKLVTATALLEAGVEPDQTVCYHGGKRRLQPKLLADDARRDRRCTTLVSAFGHSTNTVFAKLAGRGLDGPALRATAARFLFNGAIPFARPVETSTVEVGDDPFEVANTAAGFGKVRLSPLHGALLAEIVANRGVLVPPRLVAELRGAVLPPEPEPRRVVAPEVAGRLAEMMRATVTEGTARRAFRRVAPALRGVQVAGKTGSLFERAPFRDHTLFVGYAPADRPEVAIAVVVVNERTWRVRAPSLAREALEIYFGTRVADAGPAALQRVAAR